MITDFWKETTPGKPYGSMDRDAKLNFTWSVAEWLAASGEGLDLAGCTIIGDPRLQFSLDTILGATFSCRVELVDPTTPAGTQIPFTLRFAASDGQQDDRTFRLVLTDK